MYSAGRVSGYLEEGSGICVSGGLALMAAAVEVETGCKLRQGEGSLERFPDLKHVVISGVPVAPVTDFLK